MLTKQWRGVVLFALVLFSVPWVYAQQTKRGSLTPQDYLEIQQLYARYNFSIDSGDAEGYAALFTPDGSFNTNAGHDALVAFVKNRNGASQRHWNTNLMITPTSQGADGAVYLMLMNVGVNPPVISTAAKYADKLVKTGQGWRFKQRQTSREGAPRQAPSQ